MVMTFNDLERRVKRHPVEKIRELAKSPTDTADDFAPRKLHSLVIAFCRGGLAKLPPERKCLAGFDHDPIDRRARYRKILDLVFLQFRIGVPEASTEERLMFLTGIGEGVVAFLPRERARKADVRDLAKHSLLENAPVVKNGVEF
jgi:hypothetical protein